MLKDLLEAANKNDNIKFSEKGKKVIVGNSANDGKSIGSKDHFLKWCNGKKPTDSGLCDYIAKHKLKKSDLTKISKELGWAELKEV